MKYNKIPILLLVGEKDEKFKMINTDIATYTQSYTLKIISNTGHNIHRENIMAFLEEIQKFFIDKLALPYLG
jgi:2-succinyl-6-hydroxy-2,4-cyclohexadiene-1-carboxylate synthase